MRPGIVYDQIISDIDFRKHTVNGKFIVIFTEGSCDIIFVVTGGIFFSKDGDMVVRAVHGWAHQVTGTGIQAGIFFVDMLLVDALCHELAVGSQHIASKFGSPHIFDGRPRQ